MVMCSIIICITRKTVVNQESCISIKYSFAGVITQHFQEIVFYLIISGVYPTQLHFLKKKQQKTENKTNKKNEPLYCSFLKM